MTRAPGRGKKGTALRALGLSGAALGAGAAGLGLEVLLISLTGLALGYGRATALGIALFIAGWALGARVAGTWRGSASLALLGCGSTVALASWLLVPALLAVSAEHPASPTSGALATLALLAVALPQGALAPTLLRGWRPGGRAGVPLLFGLGFAGSAAGAWWLGHALPAEHGRLVAAAVGGGLALLAALVGAAALAGVRGPGADGETPAGTTAPTARGERGPRLSPRAAGLTLALLTGWVAASQWICLRIGVLWLGGMQPALTAILIASLAGLSLGALLLPALIGRRPWGVPALLGLCALPWPYWIAASHWVPPALGRTEPLLTALILVVPALLPFGAAVPLLHREVAGPRAPVLGRLLGWEALGALVGVPLTHFWLLPALGSDGALGVWALGAALAAASLAPALGRGAWVAAAICLTAGAAALYVPRAASVSLPRTSPPLSNPALTVLDLTEDEHFTVAVAHDGLLAERTLLTDGFRAAATGDDYLYMRALGHLPLLLHPAPERVAVLAFGTGTTAGAVSLHPEAARIELLELSRAVAERAHWFQDVNRGVLADLEAALAGRGRVCLVLGDGRRSLAERPGRYDVVTMEPLLPDSPFAVYLYTREFYAVARRSLAPGGLLCQWVPPQALEARTFEATVAAFTEAMPWSSVWIFGTQVLLLGAERRPDLAGERFPLAGELAAALADLGLATPAELLSCFVLEGGRWPSVPRPLTDRDPWTVYRPARGAERLFDLALNLARLRELEADPPEAWRAAVGAAGAEQITGMRQLRRAREAWAVERARMLGLFALEAELERDVDSHLTQAHAALGEHPAVLALGREVAAVRGRTEGLARLARDPSPEGARQAALSLREAARRYPDRADAHLFMAVALERMGQPEAAETALSLAFELCPRVLETPAGSSARNLGFPASDRLRTFLATRRPKSSLEGA